MGRCIKKNSGGEMKYKVVIRPETENDLKEAFSCYEDKRKGLGYNFLSYIMAKDIYKTWSLPKC